MGIRWDGGDPLADDGWLNAIANLLGLIAAGILLVVILIGATART